MDDGTTIALITFLFGLNYAGTWFVYRKVNSFNTAIKILCREHAKNHGNSEIEVGL
jgi:hypothetical protein